MSDFMLYGTNFDLICCVAIGVLYGCFKAYAKQQTKRFRDEQRELLKWQMELEKKSSDLRNKRY